jgi:hypothetical protein
MIVLTIYAATLAILLARHALFLRIANSECKAAYPAMGSYSVEAMFLSANGVFSCP